MEWKNAYWIWEGEAPLRTSDRSPLLYVQVQGTGWPAALPEADEYVVVNRLEPTSAIDDEVALRIVQKYKAVLRSAGSQVRITGLQIDYDCPTSRLKAYAYFLRLIQKSLPQGSRLSITALLDWFSSGTTIDSVLSTVDEFVPQFYDATPGRNSSGIAEPINPVKWAPIFNAKDKPYKIGVSSFGRIARRRVSSNAPSVQYFRDASPLDFARERFPRSVARSAAGEVVVRYEVTTNPGLPAILPGDIVEITFPTEASVRLAYDAVQQFAGYCTGALFFRWPTESETLALHPADVERILSGVPLTSKTELEIRDGICLERRCSDLYLRLGPDVAAPDRVIDIAAYGTFDLFVSSGSLPSVAAGNKIRVRVPAYLGRRSVYVGRVISKHSIQFGIGNS